MKLDVMESCDYVVSRAQHVSIDVEGIAKQAACMSPQDLLKISSPASFDTDLHYVNRGTAAGEAQTVQYLLVVDALNFCFWPAPGLEYEHLAGGVMAALLEDPQALSATRLAAMTGADVRKLIGWSGGNVPLQDERARLLREVGEGLLESYSGSAANLVAAAKGSAVRLGQLVTAAFPGFRDHAVYQSRQIFLYKRAQIWVGDVFGALQGQGLGAFGDMHELTMFADYRVPVVLREMGILKYTLTLQQKVAAGEEIYPGSEEEVEIRAATIVAVHQLRGLLQARLPPGSPPLLSVCLDWWLWEQGEKKRTEHPLHHRTRTIYY
mmetsp:Transcript_160/g.265  ORF Transcript_160/g.265 Transcript_160/m.265 type:complete len:323 (+) Transcript_160:123-1091(+)